MIPTFSKCYEANNTSLTLGMQFVDLQVLPLLEGGQDPPAPSPLQEAASYLSWLGDLPIHEA